jgi:hypothetical protein
LVVPALKLHAVDKAAAARVVPRDFESGAAIKRAAAATIAAAAIEFVDERASADGYLLGVRGA